jgi:hypothetical protein
MCLANTSLCVLEHSLEKHGRGVGGTYHALARFRIQGAEGRFVSRANDFKALDEFAIMAQ